MSRVKAASSPASPPLTSGSVGVMVEKRRYRSDRYRLIPVSAVYTRGERLHKIRDRPPNHAFISSNFPSHHDIIVLAQNLKPVFLPKREALRISFVHAELNLPIPHRPQAFRQAADDSASDALPLSFRADHEQPDPRRFFRRIAADPVQNGGQFSFLKKTDVSLGLTVIRK